MILRSQVELVVSIAFVAFIVSCIGASSWSVSIEFSV